ncbi:MAG: MotA/TolQ/ExbB proton channel family protein [Gammaproteobacteria bacterium]
MICRHKARHMLLNLCFAVLCAVLLAPVWGEAASNGTEKELLSRIEKAQKTRSVVENRISRERKTLMDQLNALEHDVLALREKTAGARRLADEKTVNLSKLEERLATWRHQHVYQQNILHRFLQQHGNLEAQRYSEKKPDTSNHSESTARMNAVLRVSENMVQRFEPNWVSSRIVLPSGEVLSQPSLSIGPVTWYWNEMEKQAGLASFHDNREVVLHSDVLLNASDSATIAALRENPRGEIVFDPTLDRALTRRQHADNVLEHLVKGGVWAVPIVCFAFFALSIAVVKAVQLWRLPRIVRVMPEQLQDLLSGKALSLIVHVQGMQKRLLDLARHSAQLPRQRDDQLFIQLQNDQHELERWIGAIAITASVSPLLGLLGTVSGMIETFKMMTLFGSGDPEVVSGGIAQALVTTELGLVVAIPALILNALLSRKAKAYYRELECFAIVLSKQDECEAPPSQQTHEVSTLSQEVRV